MSKDYYKILGVDRNASTDEVKKAYRKMALKYHPDKTNGDVESESKFKEAAEAYDTLSSPDKKANYDRYGSSANPFGGGGGNPFGNQQGHGFNMDDIFSQFGDIFGNSFNNRYSGGGQKRQSKGADLRIKVSLTIEDVIKGSVKKIKYKRADKCEPCSGTGGTDIRDCLPCGGTGQRTVLQNTQFGQIRQQTYCPDCSGSGKKIVNKCNICNGDGTNLKEQVLDVDIPSGLASGMQLNMNGYGNHVRNGIPGNLIIIIDEIREKYFNREGNNIVIEKNVSVIDAIIGSLVKVTTPHGEVTVTISPGTQHGEVLIIRGKGVPDYNLGLGDLLIKVNIKIPKNIEMDERFILEKLRTSKNFITN